MIRVNDKWDVAWHEGMTVEDVLAVLDFTHHYIVVSLNGVAIPPDELDRHRVSRGDALRVVHIIGGG
jgi:thiamine biosynthesis protein ThiS